MTEPTSSEQQPTASSSAAQLPPIPTRQRRGPSRVTIALAGAVLFLVGGAGGYVAHGSGSSSSSSFSAPSGSKGTGSKPSGTMPSGAAPSGSAE